MRPPSISLIPMHVEKAVRLSKYGRPGVSYLDLPGNMLAGYVDSVTIPKYYTSPEIPIPYPDPKLIQEATSLLTSAKKPLVIVGKGAAYARAEQHVNDLINYTNLPFLATPMGKGVVRDDSVNCVGSARSFALQNADVILLLGARLNWILHFGRQPRFAKDVQVVQIDLAPEEMNNSIKSRVAIQSDLKPAVESLVRELQNRRYTFDTKSIWSQDLKKKCDINKENVKRMASNVSEPLNYYAVFHQIQEVLPKNCVIVSEGANTMDIGRTMLLNDLPRHRLDAGTFGTMGVSVKQTMEK